MTEQQEAGIESPSNVTETRNDVNPSTVTQEMQNTGFDKKRKTEEGPTTGTNNVVTEPDIEIRSQSKEATPEAADA